MAQISGFSRLNEQSVSALDHVVFQGGAEEGLGSELCQQEEEEGEEKIEHLMV